MATPIGRNAAPLDASVAARVTTGRLVRSTAGRVARGITSDSREVVPGSAFVALRGDRFDGHAFLGRAIESGAALVIAERGLAGEDARADAVEVDDTLVAWGDLARAHVEAWRAAGPGARVVGITGSAGKTTTKEMTAALLRELAPCLATRGNLNNRVGLPAMAFELGREHRFAVLEMGMSLPGEIAALARVASPDVGVVVNVGLAHAGGVGGSADDVAREKGALFDGVRAGGTLVANADDPRVMGRAARADVRVVTFGRDAGASVRLVGRQPLGERGSTVLLARAGRTARFDLAIPGEAAAIDLAAAVAAAEAAAGPIDDDAIARALSGLAPIPGRMHVRSRGDIRVIDDTYNANPASVRAALMALGEMAAGRRVAVLGEMRELGADAERAHAELGPDVARAGVALLVSCGGLADVTARVASELGVETLQAADAQAASRALVERVRPGDVVLVKASRGVGAEVVSRALLGEEA